MSNWTDIKPNYGVTEIPQTLLAGIDPFLPQAKREEIYHRQKLAQAARKDSVARELLLQMLLERIQNVFFNS